MNSQSPSTLPPRHLRKLWLIGYLRCLALWIIAAFTLALFAVSAHAGYSADVYMGCKTNKTVHLTGSTVDQVCSAAVTAANAAQCAYNGSPITYSLGSVVAPQCNLVTDFSNTGGFSFPVFGSDDPPGNCGTPGASVGVRNVTVAYATDKDGKTLVGGGIPSMVNRQMCDGSCNILAGAATDAWISEIPTSTGLYRITWDIPFTNVGTSCTPTSDDASALSPTFPTPNCPGSLGQVNGKTTCVPVAPLTGMNFSGPATTVRGGNPIAGSQPTADPADRTPPTGDGGNGGGPRDGGLNGGRVIGTSVTGTGTTPSVTGTGTATGTTTFNMCGTPGQPKCVIDESGTPGTVTLPGLDGYKAAGDAAGVTISGTSDKAGLFGDGWRSFFITPQLMACSPFELPQYLGQSMGAIDPCPVVDGMRTVMGFLWAIGGFWLCLGWIKEVV